MRDAANETIKKIVTNNCIDKHLSCSNGVIGDGTGLTPEQQLDYTAPPKSLRPKMAKEAATVTIRAPQ